MYFLSLVLMPNSSQRILANMLLYKDHIFLSFLKLLLPSSPSTPPEHPVNGSVKAGTVRAMALNEETGITSRHPKSTCPASTALLFIISKFW